MALRWVSWKVVWLSDMAGTIPVALNPELYSWILYVCYSVRYHTHSSCHQLVIWYTYLNLFLCNPAYLLHSHRTDKQLSYTLCPVNQSAHIDYDGRIDVEISSFSPFPINVTLKAYVILINVGSVTDYYWDQIFLLKDLSWSHALIRKYFSSSLDSPISMTVTPSSPVFYRYVFHPHEKSVRVKVESNDTLCTIFSIQDGVVNNLFMGMLFHALHHYPINLSSVLYLMMRKASVSRDIFKLSVRKVPWSSRWVLIEFILLPWNPVSFCYSMFRFIFTFIQHTSTSAGAVFIVLLVKHNDLECNGTDISDHVRPCKSLTIVQFDHHFC